MESWTVEKSRERWMPWQFEHVHSESELCFVTTLRCFCALSFGEGTVPIGSEMAPRARVECGPTIPKMTEKLHFTPTRVTPSNKARFFPFEAFLNSPQFSASIPGLGLVQSLSDQKLQLLKDNRFKTDQTVRGFWHDKMLSPRLYGRPEKNLSQS